jgi:hypothetical protein
LWYTPGGEIVVLKTNEYWLLCNLATLAIILVGVNVWLYLGNQSAQAQVNARAQYIQQTQPISDIHQQMAKALAELSVKNKDEQVRAMLSQEGFTFSPAPTAPEKSATPAAAKGGKQ